MPSLRSSVRFGIFIIAGIIVVAAIVLSLQAPDIRGHLGVLPGILANPLSVAIATAVLIFLVVERWRNLESDLGKLRDDQHQTLRDIKSDSEDLLKSKMDQVTNRAQSIEGKISDLIDKHPWVTDISEMEIIPDSPLCRVVLATAEELLTTKAPLLCYEYLSAVLRNKSEMNLEGVSGDFLDLAAFCEIALQDSYLAYRAIAKGIDCSTSYSELVPYYLRLAVRHGDYRTASNMARAITRQITPSGFMNYLIMRQMNRGGALLYLPIAVERSRKRNSDVESLVSLALFQAAYGRRDRSDRFIKKAQTGMLNPETTAVNPEEWALVQIAAAESKLLDGMWSAARRSAASLSIDESLSTPTLGEALHVLRRVDLRDSASRAEEILRDRLRRHLRNRGSHLDDGRGQGVPDPTAAGAANGHNGAEPVPTRHRSLLMPDGVVIGQAGPSHQNSEHESPVPPGAPRDPL